MTTAVERTPGRAGRRSTDEPDETRRHRAASPLAITAVVLGALGTLMALGVVWFFMALPFGIAAAVCALVDRRRSKRRTGAAAGGVTTVGLVLGLACIPLSFGALLIIPQVGKVAENAADTVQGDVATDLDGVEQTTTDNVNRLDATLREIVRKNDEAIRKDLDQLERSTAESLARSERQLRELLAQFEQTTRSELDRLEAAASVDVGRYDQRIAALEAYAKTEVDALRRELADLRRIIDDGG
jgi:hypothetical protein